MAACRRGCQTNLVALALYTSECQFRTVSSRLAPVKLSRPGRAAGPTVFPPGEPNR
jgi:hypothetical protein